MLQMYTKMELLLTVKAGFAMWWSLPDMDREEPFLYLRPKFFTGIFEVNPN